MTDEELKVELLALDAVDVLRAALIAATADAATHGIGIMQDGKRIAPQDFFAVRDVDDKS